MNFEGKSSNARQNFVAACIAFMKQRMRITKSNRRLRHFCLKDG